MALIMMHTSSLKIHACVVMIVAVVNFLIQAPVILTVHANVILALILLMHLGVKLMHVLRVTGIFMRLLIRFGQIPEANTLLTAGVTGPIIKTRHTSVEGL